MRNAIKCKIANVVRDSVEWRILLFIILLKCVRCIKNIESYFIWTQQASLLICHPIHLQSRRPSSVGPKHQTLFYSKANNWFEFDSRWVCSHRKPGWCMLGFQNNGNEGASTTTSMWLSSMTSMLLFHVDHFRRLLNVEICESIAFRNR